MHVEGEEISQDPGSLERLFRAARSPHIRERHAGGQSPSWFPASQQVQHAAGRVRRHPEAVAWLVRALKDEQRKWFEGIAQRVPDGECGAPSSPQPSPASNGSAEDPSST